MTDLSAHKSWWQIGEIVFGVPFLLGIGLNFFLPLPLYPSAFSPVGIIIGVALIITGLMLISAARRELARLGQPTDPGQPTTKIASSGVYGLSRNPLYLAAVLLFAGLGIALNNLWALASLVPGIIGGHYILIAPEERYLKALFGEEYLRYAERVNRWVGRH